MIKFNEQLIQQAQEQKERSLKISAYTLIGIGSAGMLFFMFSFLFNPQGREASAQILGFVFTSLVFAFGISSLDNITRQGVSRKNNKNNFRK